MQQPEACVFVICLAQNSQPNTVNTVYVYPLSLRCRFFTNSPALIIYYMVAQILVFPCFWRYKRAVVDDPGNSGRRNVCFFRDIADIHKL